MVFSSAVFLVYFLPVLLLAYFAAPRQLKNWVILLFSILFYSWGAPKFIFVIIGTTFLDFHLVKMMWRSQNPLHRKGILALSVSVNLGLLIYFKYSNFFIENINSALSVLGGGPIHWTKLILPIGISFYTFETITYIVDVYRGIHRPLDRFRDYLLYILLFPKLIAGPIIRYHDLADQLTDRSGHENADNRLLGLFRFAVGLAKKVLIANVMGEQADLIFNSDFAELGTAAAWTGLLAYTFQIYFDFSGYSDMAIGLGKMMGFRFPENFNNPYISGSITEFWRRWHMTLGSWMRHYLYIPLGGNRVASSYRLYFNLWLVFLASGFWHGASWSFILWGAYHGLFLVLERSFLSRVYARIGRVPATAVTFLVVVIGWVFFRVEAVGDAFAYLGRMFSLSSGTTAARELWDTEFSLFFLLAALFSFFTAFRSGLRLHDAVFFARHSATAQSLAALATLLLLFLSLASITSLGFNPFIYFRF